MRYFIISACVHALFLLCFLVIVNNPQQEKHKEYKSASSGKTSLGQKKDQIIEIDPVYNSPTKEKCDHFYYGIGIVDEFDGRIVEVADGYPAAKSGLKVNDIIKCDEEIRGESIKTLNIHVIRGAKEFDLKITREKICFK